MIRSIAFAVTLLAAAGASAETVSCPDMSAARQVGSCADEQELKMAFTGYCSDNARMYDKDDVTCISLENYKKLKDVALWEAGDFQGYLFCALKSEEIKAARNTDVSVGKAGTMTRVACGYENGLTMSLRTRKACRVDGGKAECD